MNTFIIFVSVLIFIAPKFDPVDPIEPQDMAYVDVNCTSDIWSSICEVKHLVVLYPEVPAVRLGYWNDYDSTHRPGRQPGPPQTQPPQTQPPTAPPSAKVTENAANKTASTKPPKGNGTSSTGNGTTPTGNGTTPTGNGTTPAPTTTGNVTNQPTENETKATTKATGNGTSQGQPQEKTVANGTAAVSNENSSGSPGKSATEAKSDALIDHPDYHRPNRFIRRAQSQPRVVRQVDQGIFTLRSTRAPIQGQPKELLLIVNCNTTYLPNGLGTLFPNMLSFVIWFSGLRFVTPGNFYLMTYVREINFQDNLIENLPIETFFFCLSLTTLNLSGNKIKMLPVELFKTNLYLQNFIANRNQIQFLPAKLFENTTEIVYLNFNNNLIKVINIDFTLLKNLKKVLGLQNTCADFFMNKVVSAEQLNALCRANCSAKAGKDGS